MGALVVLQTQCNEENGNVYAKAERAKKRDETPEEGALLDRACTSAALALASIVAADEAAATDEKAAERAEAAREAEEANRVVKDAGAAR